MDEYKENKWIIAIVAIVAIVALVVLVINIGGKQNYTTNGVSNVGQATAVLIPEKTTTTSSKITTPQKTTSSSTPTESVPTTMPRDNLYYIDMCEWCDAVWEHDMEMCRQIFQSCSCFLPSGEIGDPHTMQSWEEYWQCMAPCEQAYNICETRASADYYACLIGHNCGTFWG